MTSFGMLYISLRRLHPTSFNGVHLDANSTCLVQKVRVLDRSHEGCP